MKKVLYLSILSLLIFNGSYSQNKDELIYKAKVISVQLIENYNTSKAKILSSSIIGKDVTISIDTIFKKYSFLYTNADNEREGISLLYQFDQIEGLEPGTLFFNRFFLMKDKEENYYWLTDYKDLFKKITFEYIKMKDKKKEKEKSSLVYTINNMY